MSSPTFRAAVAFTVCLIAALACSGSTQTPTPVPSGRDSPAPLHTPLPFNTRVGYTITELPDGRALVLERRRGAEIFDPATGSLRRLPGLEYAHNAALLADGRVLIIGGADDPRTPLPVTLFDPVTDELADAPPTLQPHSWPTTVLLDDCTVLIVGGTRSQYAGESVELLSQGEIFDPVSGSWKPGGLMASVGPSHQAVRLADGRVAAFNMATDAGVEIFDPSTLTWDRATK